MKKILKRLLISTALITPIAISTPLLLTSCSTNAELSDTGPSIFKGAYGLELFAGDSNKSKGYYLKAELNKGNNLNEIFTKVLNEVPKSPKFDDIAKPTSALFNLGTFVVNEAPTLPAGLTNKVNYSEYKLLPNQQLSESGKSAAISKIFENIVFKSTDNTADSTNDKNVLAYFPSTAFDLDKFKNDITYDVVYTVKQDDIKDSSGNITKRVILSDISFSFKLKDTSKSWAYLKTSDPIFVSISWTDDSKATLFEGGFKSAPSITESGNEPNKTKSINFTGTLNESVFGSDASKIDKTSIVKQWFEGATGDKLNSTQDNTIDKSTDLKTANDNISSKIVSIFNNIDNVSNTGAQTQVNNTRETITFTKDKLLSTFIEGVSTKATPVALGSQNVKVSIAKISKKAGKADQNRTFTIELEFKLNNDNEPGWYGLTGEAAKLPIKFILDVTTTTPSQGK